MTTNNVLNNYSPGSVGQNAYVQDSGSTTGSNSFVDVTGATATITPRSSSSRILIMMSALYQVSLVALTQTQAKIQCLRGVTVIGGTPYATLGATEPTSGTTTVGIYNFVFVDSPATTSATTYKFQQEITPNNGQTIQTFDLSFVLMELT